MHELGIVIEIAKVVEEVMQEQNLQKLDSVVLQIGELSDIIPDFLTECWKVVQKDSQLDGVKLVIETTKAMALCPHCNKEFLAYDKNLICPICKTQNCKIVSGREFLIKEIVAS